MGWICHNQSTPPFCSFQLDWWVVCVYLKLLKKWRKSAEKEDNCKKGRQVFSAFISHFLGQVLPSRLWLMDWRSVTWIQWSLPWRFVSWSLLRLLCASQDHLAAMRSANFAYFWQNASPSQFNNKKNKIYFNPSTVNYQDSTWKPHTHTYTQVYVSTPPFRRCQQQQLALWPPIFIIIMLIFKKKLNR